MSPLALAADPLYYGFVYCQKELCGMGDSAKLTEEFEAIASLVRGTAAMCGQESQQLLSLLRLLESLHREIRTQQFEPSLPHTRSSLYQMLRDIEEEGGWPYIERMRLRTFLNHFFPEENDALKEDSE